MHCEKCDFSNPLQMRFCGQCATPLKRQCSDCHFINPIDFEFCGHCASTLFSSLVAEPLDVKTRIHSMGRHDAERRQLTVLFCDMVGSSSLSEQVDPEDLRDIMRSYHQICNQVVVKHDGHVAQYLGDGILVYFGYPLAHEDDARRAIQAALDIIKLVSKFRYTRQHQEPLSLAVRIAVHTGLVVVGEMGKGDKRSLALGDTPNIAARLQNFAEPNTVVITANSYRLVQRNFDCQPLGLHQLKGFSFLTSIYKVQGICNNQTQFKGKATHQNRLVGREQETKLLLRRMDQARKGSSQVVLLSGEPGLGKTRMVQLVWETLGNHPCFLFGCAGTPYYKNSYLYPIIDLLQRTLGLSGLGDDTRKRARLQKSIASLGLNTREVVPILAELLNLPPLDHHTTPPFLTPQQKKSRMIKCLVTLLRAMMKIRLVLFVVEDLQWLDSLTLELLKQLVEQPDNTNLFALFTFRSGFSPLWNKHADITHIRLNRLPRKQSGYMIRQMCHGKTLPEELFTEILNKTDGIPYFVEEITNMVLQSKTLLEKKEHFELIVPMSKLAIPSTLHDSLMSRLDKLGDAKKLAQLCAILGRDFTHELLSVVTSRDECQLEKGLNHLVDSELITRRGDGSAQCFSFRHALLREAAYHSLLKRTRKNYHERIARLLKTRFQNVIRNTPEIIAYHCTEAGNNIEAVDYWLAAGQSAIKRSANIEAVTHFNQGLTALALLPDSPSNRAKELALQVDLGLAITMLKGYVAPEVEAAYTRAQVLCQDIDDPLTLFVVMCGLWNFYLVRADLNKSFQLAEQLQKCAVEANKPIMILTARRIMGSTLFWRGELHDALTYLDAPEVVILPQNSESTGLLIHYQNARVAALANASCILLLLGEKNKALSRANEALILAKTLSYPFGQAYALHFLSTAHQISGDYQRTGEYAKEQIALSEVYGFSFWVATGNMLQAWATSADMNGTIDYPRFESALKVYEASGNRLANSYFLAVLASMYQKTGRFDDARLTVKKALLETAETGERVFISELFRLQGELALSGHQRDAVAAEKNFKCALNQAKQQGAVVLMLKAAICLATLWIKNGKAKKANCLLHELLAELPDELTGVNIDIARSIIKDENKIAPSYIGAHF
ncbi:MAG: AAA family ATPase [Gammaproteobacteria bacterium]|nr:AAA family ATPase [Gammaproteobacteria bacterium]